MRAWMLAHTGLDIVAKLFGNRHVSRALKSVCFRSWGCRYPDQQMTRPTEFCPCIGLELRRVSFNGNATGHKSNHQGRTDTTAVIPVYVSRLAFRQMFICGFFFWLCRVCCPWRSDSALISKLAYGLHSLSTGQTHRQPFYDPRGLWML